MKPIRYGRGNALTIVNEATVMLVEHGDGVDVDELWEVTSTATSVLDILDVLSRNGISSLPAFAAVIDCGDHYSAIVRGDFAIDVLGESQSHHWDGRGIATWAEHSVTCEDLDGIRITTGAPGGSSEDDDAAEGSMLPLRSGVVHADQLLIGRMVAASSGAPAPASDATIFDISDIDDLGRAELGESYEDEDAYDDEASVAGDTVSRLPAPPVAVPDIEDEFDHTMTRDELRRMREAAAAAAGDADADVDQVPADDGTVARLRLSNGKEVVVSGPTLIGRAPQARNVSSDELPQLVIVDDPYVSSTHLEVEYSSEDGLLVTDRSSNGTLHATPGSTSSQLPKGQRTTVSNGDTLRISDDLYIQVLIA